MPLQGYARRAVAVSEIYTGRTPSDVIEYSQPRASLIGCAITSSQPLPEHAKRPARLLKCPSLNAITTT